MINQLTITGIYVIFLPCEIDLKFFLSLSQTCKVDSVKQSKLLTKEESMAKLLGLAYCQCTSIQKKKFYHQWSISKPDMEEQLL